MSRSEMEQGFTPLRTGDRNQIFNIEAYCKLCNKEFCNKYFLKTHMANKHGIYSDGGSGGSGGGAVPGGPRFEPGAGSLSLQPSSRELYDKSPRFPGSSSAPPVPRPASRLEENGDKEALSV